MTVLSIVHSFSCKLRLVVLGAALLIGLFGCVSSGQGEQTTERLAADSATKSEKSRRSDEQTAETRLLREGAEKTLANRLEAANRGDPVAQRQLGSYYLTGEVGSVKEVVPVDYELAFTWLSRAAEQKERLAPYYLGVLYFDAKKDYSAALKWFLSAAEQQVALSYRYLWLIYRDGLGVEPNPETAASWERKDLEFRRSRITK